MYSTSASMPKFPLANHPLPGPCSKVFVHSPTFRHSHGAKYISIHRPARSSIVVQYLFFVCSRFVTAFGTAAIAFYM